MDLSPLTQLGAPTAASTQAAAGLTATFDSFLLLLTTQLQNQDPLEPLKASEFTGQLVQFASVEQQISGNKNLEKLIALQQSSQAASAVGFIGSDIEAIGNKVTLSDGKAAFNYTLNTQAGGVTVSILNEQGNVVRSLTGDSLAGKHDVVWDGRDAQGTALPDGTYTIKVTALDGEGTSLSATVAVLGRVTGVNMAGGNILLKMGDVEIPIDKVLSVSRPATAGSPGA